MSRWAPDDEGWEAIDLTALPTHHVGTDDGRHVTAVVSRSLQVLEVAVEDAFDPNTVCRDIVVAVNRALDRAEGLDRDGLEARRATRLEEFDALMDVLDSDVDAHRLD